MHLEFGGGAFHHDIPIDHGIPVDRHAQVNKIPPVNHGELITTAPGPIFNGQVMEVDLGEVFDVKFRDRVPVFYQTPNRTSLDTGAAHILSTEHLGINVVIVRCVEKQPIGLG